MHATNECAQVKKVYLLSAFEEFQKNHAVQPA